MRIYTHSRAPDAYFCLRPSSKSHHRKPTVTTRPRGPRLLIDVPPLMLETFTWPYIAWRGGGVRTRVEKSTLLLSLLLYYLLNSNR